MTHFHLCPIYFLQVTPLSASSGTTGKEDHFRLLETIKMFHHCIYISQKSENIRSQSGKERKLRNQSLINTFEKIQTFALLTIDLLRILSQIEGAITSF